MDITSRFVVKRARDAEKGELIEFEYEGNHALGVALDQAKRSSELIAAVFSLSDDSARLPFWTHIPEDARLLSYGLGWSLELLPSVGFEGDRSDGVIYVDGKSGVMRFGADEAGNSTLHIAFPEVKPGGNEGSGLAIQEWAIWARAADIADPDAEPLFVFSKPEPIAEAAA